MADAPDWTTALARWLPPPLPRQPYTRQRVAHAITRARADGMAVPQSVDARREGQWLQLRAVATGRCEATPSAVRTALAAIGTEAAALLDYLDGVDAQPARATATAQWLAALHPPAGSSAQHLAALAAHTRGPVACLACLRRVVAPERPVLRLAAADDAVRVTLRCGPWGPGLAIAVVLRSTAQGHHLRATLDEAVVLPRGLQLVVGLCFADGGAVEVAEELLHFERGIETPTAGTAASLAAIWAKWQVR